MDMECIIEIIYDNLNLILSHHLTHVFENAWADTCASPGSTFSISAESALEQIGVACAEGISKSYTFITCR